MRGHWHDLYLRMPEGLKKLSVLWLRLSLWLRERFSKLSHAAPALLPGKGTSSCQRVFGPRSLQLHADTIAALENLATHHPGIVTATITDAIEDYFDFKKVLNGPAAGIDVVADISLLSDAEEVLDSLIHRATEVAVLAEVAGNAQQNKATREAAGDAILALQDQRRLLQSLTQSAVQWAASKSDEDQALFERAVKKLSAQRATKH